MEPIAADPPQLHFHFVTVGQKGVPHRNRRLVELAESSARSHAARVSHPKYKTRRPSKSSRSPSLEHAAIKAEETPSLTMTVPISASPLDPFIPLSIPLSQSERSLVHDYLTDVPEQIYGTNANSLFCPVRISTAAGIATNEIWLRWMLLLVEHKHTVLRGDNPETAPVLIRRRTVNYHVMQQKIAVPDPSSLSDEIFYGLVSAGVAEYRVNNPIAAVKHLEAGLTIVDARRKAGLPLPDTGTTGLISCSGYIGDGVTNYFKSAAALSRVEANVCQRLSSMQTWILALRQQHQHFPGVPPSHSLTRLHIHKALDRAKINVYNTRTCLGILFAMNSILWACRHDDRAACEFVQELEYYIRASRVDEGARAADEDRAVTTSLQLAPMTVLWIVAFCGSRIQNKYGGEGRGRRRYDLWDVVDFVELIMLAGEETRERVRMTLGGWALMGFADGEKAEVMVLDGEDPEVLAREVDAGWRRKQKALATELTRETSDRL